MAGFDQVSQLKPYKSMWKIKVKIVRQWKQYSAQSGETVELVLVDSIGDKIHASIKKELVAQFEEKLNEGDSKIMINFAVTHACGSYRTTNHAYKIGFLATTRLRSCEDLPMHVTGFTPAKFQEILDGSLNTDYLVEGGGEWYNDEEERLVFSLINPEFIQIKCIAYGSNARELLNYWTSTHANVVLCVLTFWQIQWGEGGFKFMTNIEGCSKILFNPEIPEIQAFRTRIPDIAV